MSEIKTGLRGKWALIFSSSRKWPELIVSPFFFKYMDFETAHRVASALIRYDIRYTHNEPLNKELSRLRAAIIRKLLNS